VDGNGLGDEGGIAIAKALMVNDVGLETFLP
jgi:hypothetical protein